MCIYVFTMLVWLWGKSTCKLFDFVCNFFNGCLCNCGLEWVEECVSAWECVCYYTRFFFIWIFIFFFFWVYIFVPSKSKSWSRSYTRFTNSNDYLNFLMNTLKKISKTATALVYERISRWCVFFVLYICIFFFFFVMLIYSNFLMNPGKNWCSSHCKQGKNNQIPKQLPIGWN